MVHEGRRIWVLDWPVDSKAAESNVKQELVQLQLVSVPKEERCWRRADATER